MEDLKQKCDKYKISLRKDFLKKMLNKKRKMIYYENIETKKYDNIKKFENIDKILDFFKHVTILLITIKKERDFPKIKVFFLKFYKTINNETTSYLDLLIQIFQKLDYTKNFLKFLVRFQEMEKETIFYILKCLSVISRGNNKLMKLFKDFICPISKIIVYYKKDKKIMDTCFNILGNFLMENKRIKNKLDEINFFKYIFDNFKMNFFENNENWMFFLYNYFTQLEFDEINSWLKFFGKIFLENFFNFKNLNDSMLSIVTNFFFKYSQIMSEKNFFTIFELNKNFDFFKFIDILILLISKEQEYISSFCIEFIVNITSFSNNFLINSKILEILDKNNIEKKLEKIINKNNQQDIKILKICSHLVLSKKFFFKIKNNNFLTSWIFLMITRDDKNKKVIQAVLNYIRNYFIEENKENIIQFIKNNKYLMICLINLIQKNQSNENMIKIYYILDIIKNIQLNNFNNLFFTLIESDESLNDQIINNAFCHPNEKIKEFYKELMNKNNELDL